MTWTHDLTDPEADAEARELIFSQEQAGFVAHHVRNALAGVKATPEAAHRRILNMTKAIEARVFVKPTQKKRRPVDVALETLSTARRALRVLGHTDACRVHTMFAREPHCDCGLTAGDLELARAEEFVAKGRRGSR